MDSTAISAHGGGKGTLGIGMHSGSCPISILPATSGARALWTPGSPVGAVHRELGPGGKMVRLPPQQEPSVLMSNKVELSPLRAPDLVIPQASPSLNGWPWFLPVPVCLYLPREPAKDGGEENVAK